MPALGIVIIILSVAFGYLILTKGPLLFAALIATATAIAYRAIATRTDAKLHALQGNSLRRLREDEGWARDRTEQQLLNRSLKLALKQTELFSQYPASAVHGSQIAARFGLA